MLRAGPTDALDAQRHARPTRAFESRTLARWTEESKTGWGLERVRRVVTGVRLDDAQQEAFLDHIGETNCRRLQVLLPMAVVGHVVHILAFWVTSTERARLSETVIAWREGVVASHVSTAIVAALLAVAAFRLRRHRLARAVGAVGTVTYLWHGAACAGVDQLTVATVTPYVGYAMAGAIFVYQTPRQAIAVYALGVVGFVIGVQTFQVDPNVRLAVLPNGISVSVGSIALAWVLYLARRREFYQREVIERQRRELVDLNAELEQRVEEQVAEIVERAGEIDQLNAQLRAQVRDRSAELSRALARLAAGTRGASGLLPKGAVLADRFEVGDVIGEGGMGTVYEGLDRERGGPVAIKVIRLETARKVDALQRFLREAKIAASVSHPAIVQVLHVDVGDDGVLFQVQELVKGDSLRARLRPRVRWDAAVAARLGATLSAALAYAHARGVVHRDVKPANVMLTDEEPGLKLLDFGVAKLFQDAMAEGKTTRTGTVVGTPHYMAPEQFDAGAEVTPRADVYAVGVLLFLLLTGRYPRNGANFAELLRAHWIDVAPLPKPRTLAPDVPDDLADLVLRCLDRDPGGRPSSAELASTLRAVADRLEAEPLHVLERRYGVYDRLTAGSQVTAVG